MLIPFDLPVDGVNHTLKLPSDIDWWNFQWEVAGKLRVFPADIQLSYKLASQPKGDLARALTGEQDLAGLVERSWPFVNGTRKCGRGKEFCVQLFPKVSARKDAENQDGNKKATPIQGKKVCTQLLRATPANVLAIGEKERKKVAWYG